MSDLINREQAIEAIAGAIWHYPNLNFLSDYDHAHELAEDALKRLSSAEPERKTGRWIQHPIYEGSDHYYYACSECDYRSWSKDNFCSVCGAKMKEEEVSNGSD